MAQSQQPQMPMDQGKGAGAAEAPGQEAIGAQALADLNISWQSESVDLDILFDSLGADSSTVSYSKGAAEGGIIVGESTVPLPVSLDSLEAMDDADLAAISSQVIADQS